MSNLAKVFIVFNLILSLLFFGSSATLFKTRLSWKSAYEDYKQSAVKEIGDLRTHAGSLNKQIDEGVKTLRASQASENQLAKDNKQFRSDLAAEQAKVSATNSAREKADILSQQIAKTLETETQRSQQVAQERDKAKAERETALNELEAANRARDAMTLDLAKTQEALSTTRKEFVVLSQKAEEQELRLNAIMDKYGPIIKIPDPLQPPIDALVSAVDANEPLVVLSVGKNLNVEPGYKFTVARGDEFIGKVEVIKVYPNLSGARILFTKEGQQIQRGDKAFTPTTTD